MNDWHTEDARRYMILRQHDELMKNAAAYFRGEHGTNINNKQYEQVNKDMEPEDIMMSSQELTMKVERLTAERDSARREVLLWLGERCSRKELTQEIKKRGWEYLETEECRDLIKEVNTQ